MVSNALLDAVKERVRSNSPRARSGKERATTPIASRDHSPEGTWTRSRAGLVEQNHDSDAERGRRISRDEEEGKHKEKEKSTFGRISDALGFDAEDGAGWKEFRKGRWTFSSVYEFSHN